MRRIVQTVYCHEILRALFASDGGTTQTITLENIV